MKGPFSGGHPTHPRRERAQLCWKAVDMLSRLQNMSFILNIICFVAVATSSLYFNANLRGCNFLYINAALHSELADATGKQWMWGRWWKMTSVSDLPEEGLRG